MAISTNWKVPEVAGSCRKWPKPSEKIEKTFRNDHLQLEVDRNVPIHVILQYIYIYLLYFYFIIFFILLPSVLPGVLPRESIKT